LTKERLMMTLCAPNHFTPRDLRNYRVFGAWMLAACLAFSAATLLIDGGFIPASVGWVMTAATAVLMLIATRSYVVFLRNADELLRKVHIEALALAFGVGLVAMMVYRLCERLGAPKLDVNDGGLVLVLVWIAGQLFGGRRYSGPEEQ
jgi:hypothetical protein